MNRSQEVNQPTNHPSLFNAIPQRNLSSNQSKHDMFSFFKSGENPLRPSSFFSQNDLSQDIIKVTDAEPDICLEVFCALYHVLWPQIERQSSIPLKEAWTNSFGNSTLKGIFWSPEKLIGDPQEVKTGFSENDGEKHVFRYLDDAVESILNLKTKLEEYTGEIFQRDEIMASLELVQEFYSDFRSKVKDLVKRIIEKESMDKNPMAEYHALENLLEPKAMMTSDIFAGHWAYCIPRKKAQKLLSLDKWKNPTKNHSNGESIYRIAALPEKTETSEPLVYFKANRPTAIQPEKEFMLYSLYRELQTPVPETALLVLMNVFGDDPNYYYVVQASKVVTGESALEAWKSQEKIFEEKAEVEQARGNPSDGKFKDFKISRQLHDHNKDYFGGNKLDTEKTSGNKNNQRFNKHNDWKFNEEKRDDEIQDGRLKFASLIKGVRLEGGKLLIPKSLFDELKKLPGQIEQAEFIPSTIVQNSSNNPSQGFGSLHAPLSSLKAPNEENK